MFWYLRKKGFTKGDFSDKLICDQCHTVMWQSSPLRNTSEGHFKGRWTEEHLWGVHGHLDVPWLWQEVPLPLPPPELCFPEPMSQSQYPPAETTVTSLPWALAGSSATPLWVRALAITTEGFGVSGLFSLSTMQGFGVSLR